MYIRGWVAYYSGGVKYSSADTAPTALPQTGMLVWMLYFTDGTRRVLHGNDRYFFFDDGSDEGIFANTDESSAEILSRYPGAYIIEGEFVDDTEYNSTIKSAFRVKEM